ncbi:metalloprotease [Entomophthora muscae]|uniref:Metalloprotease n=1 Tax=Entomophthora muscae TaxID=34485 RepID=A0ACC2SH93_9FUNG|nr:metalloprotease [Entomophthora muscae]
MNYNLTLESFKALKEEVVTYFSTRPCSNYTSTQDIVNAQLNTFNRDNVLREKAASGTTFQEFKAFFDSFHTTLQFNIIGSSRTSGKVLTQIKTQLESIFRLNPCNTEYLKNKHRPLPINGNFVRVEKEPQEISLTTVYLQLYDSNKVKEAAMALVTQALSNRQYAYQLRTIEHLAYLLTTSHVKIGSGGRINCTIESDQPGVYLESHIEAFLEQFAGQVKGISNKSLNKTLVGLVKDQKSFLANPKPNPSNSWKVIQETIATRRQSKLNYIPS